MGKNNTNQIDFLYASINDAQDLIKFTDTKTAFAVTIIGAFIFIIFSSLKDLVTYFSQFSQLFKIELLLLLFCITSCIYLIIQILSPTINPLDKIINDTKIKVKFFLSENKYHRNMAFFNLKRHKLKYDFKEYLNSLGDSTEMDLIESLTSELFKISYTRNLKNDRFVILIKFLTVTTIIFAVEYLTFLSQLQKIAPK